MPCPRRGAAGALRDAVAWARVFVGDELRATVSSFDGAPARNRGLALLEASGGASVSLIAAASHGAPPLGRVRATRLGERLVEFDGDEHRQRFEVGDAAGHRVLPRLFEAPERVALRRAAAAFAAGGPTDDVAGFARDDAVALAITAALVA